MCISKSEKELKQEGVRSKKAMTTYRYEASMIATDMTGDDADDMTRKG